MINTNSKIFVAGHKGLVGSAIVRRLKEKNFKNILIREKSRLDLTDQRQVLKFLKRIKKVYGFPFLIIYLYLKNLFTFLENLSQYILKEIKLKNLLKFILRI